MKKEHIILQLADKTAPSTEAHKTFGIFSVLLWLFVGIMYVVSVLILYNAYHSEISQHVPQYSTFVTITTACIIVAIGLLSVHLLGYSIALQFKLKWIVACILAFALFYGGSMTATVFGLYKQVKHVSNKVEIEAVQAKFDNRIEQIQHDANILRQSYLQSIDSLKKRKVADWLVYSTNKTILQYYKAISNIDSTAKADVQALQMQKNYESNVLQAKADENAVNFVWVAVVLIGLDLFSNFSLVWLQSMFRKRTTVYELKNENNYAKEATQTTNVIQTTNNIVNQTNIVINEPTNKYQKSLVSDKWKAYYIFLMQYDLQTLETMTYQQQIKAANGTIQIPEAKETRSAIKRIVKQQKQLKN